MSNETMSKESIIDESLTNDSVTNESVTNELCNIKQQLHNLTVQCQTQQDTIQYLRESCKNQEVLYYRQQNYINSHARKIGRIQQVIYQLCGAIFDHKTELDYIINYMNYMLYNNHTSSEYVEQDESDESESEHEYKYKSDSESEYEYEYESDSESDL
jgi:hypothetical protein